ncbi:MAG: hypothetical protein FWE70_03640 [Oscillospiraceae bacterium]|nr:hypothetical protein [Oscillospiraceae bacterium]
MGIQSAFGRSLIPIAAATLLAAPSLAQQAQAATAAPGLGAEAMAIIAEANEEISSLFGFEGYYAERNAHGLAIDEGGILGRTMFVYGEPHGYNPANGLCRYSGYSLNGNAYPNDAYPPDSWSVVRHFEEWAWVSEPAKKVVDGGDGYDAEVASSEILRKMLLQSQFDGFAKRADGVSPVGDLYLENIVIGIGMKYGGQKKSNGTELLSGAYAMTTPGGFGAAGYAIPWHVYTHVIQPPTRRGWGLGVLLHKTEVSYFYVTVPIAPFEYCAGGEKAPGGGAQGAQPAVPAASSASSGWSPESPGHAAASQYADGPFAGAADYALTPPAMADERRVTWVEYRFAGYDGRRMPIYERREFQAELLVTDRADRSAMKSGYGLSLEVETRIWHDYDYPSSFVGVQEVRAYFPESSYAHAVKLVPDHPAGSLSNVWRLPESPLSVLGERRHYVPVRFPDGKDYVVLTAALYAWAPGGWMRGSATVAVRVEGSMYDDDYMVRR